MDSREVYSLVDAQGVTQVLEATKEYQGDWPLWKLGGTPVSIGGLNNYLHMRGLKLKREPQSN